MNTHALVAEFVNIQKQRSDGGLDDLQRTRWEDLRQALALAEVRLPVSLRPVEATGPRMRIRDGEQVREVALDRLSAKEVEIQLDQSSEPGQRAVVVIAPGPGMPAFAAYARTLGPADRGQGWVRLALE